MSPANDSSRLASFLRFVEITVVSGLYFSEALVFITGFETGVSAGVVFLILFLFLSFEADATLVRGVE